MDKYLLTVDLPTKILLLLYYWNTTSIHLCFTWTIGVAYGVNFLSLGYPEL